MVGSKVNDDDPHHTDGHVDVGGGEEGMEPPSSGVACSICLDLVTVNGARSRAKLQCGHEFHLDCIGSAFNMKGAMQCPNCRRIEKGQWFYANGSTRTLPELSMEDWIPSEDFYDLSYSEMPYRFDWCPFGEFAQVGSSFEEVEPPSTTYHDLRGHNAIFTEHTGASSMTHSYVAYVGPAPPTTSRSSNNVDDPHLNHHWNGLLGQNEIFTPRAYPAVNIHYHSWDRHPSPFSISGNHMSSSESTPMPHATMGSSHGDSDAAPIPRTFHHPLVIDHGSSPRAGSSFVSSVVPRRPRSGALTHERIHALHHHHQQPPSNSPGLPTNLVHGIRRFDGPRSVAAVIPAPLQQDLNGSFYVLPPSSSGHNVLGTANPSLNHVNVFERERSSRFPSVSRESSWVPFHQTTSGSNMGNGSGSLWHRHSS